MAKNLPLFKIIANEIRASFRAQRVIESQEVRSVYEHLEKLNQVLDESGQVCGHHYFMLSELLSRIPPQAKVLDLASGTGNFLLDVAELRPDAQFIGLERSQSALEFAEQSRKARGIKNVKFILSQIADLRIIPDEAVDFVMSTMSLHHLDDSAGLEKSFSEIHRVLRPGGNIFIIDFSRMRNPTNMELFVRSVAASENLMFQNDMISSMRAAFAPEEFANASTVLSERKIQISGTPFPAIIVIHNQGKLSMSPEAREALRQHWRRLPRQQKVSSFMLRVMLGVDFW